MLDMIEHARATRASPTRAERRRQCTRCASFPGYGKLSGKSLDDLRAGERVEVDDGQATIRSTSCCGSAPSPASRRGTSPWGAGPPGLAHRVLGDVDARCSGTHFDIHGGGMDLQFPHHENEIAQSRGRQRRAVRRTCWMHNGFLNVDDEKMSKSLGNFFTRARGAAERYDIPRCCASSCSRATTVVRSTIRSSSCEQADAALTRLYTALRDLPAAPDATGAHTARFLDSMDDDFNTPEALAVLQQLATEVNSARAARDMPRAAALGAELMALGRVLGLLAVDPAQWFRLAAPAAGAQLSDAQIEAGIAARAAARRAKNWAESDRIRDELAAAGVILEDKAGGATTWRRG